MEAELSAVTDTRRVTAMTTVCTEYRYFHRDATGPMRTKRGTHFSGVRLWTILCSEGGGRDTILRAPSCEPPNSPGAVVAIALCVRCRVLTITS